MTFIGQPMTDHREKEPVPSGKYIIRIKNYKTMEKQDGTISSVAIFHEVDGEPDAAEVTYFLNLVQPEDDDKKKYWKLAYQKGYFRTFGLEWSDEGFDPESWYGAEAEVSLEKQYNEKLGKEVNTFEVNPVT